ncbi:MAG: FKBP-type peptidyl-prolyl cis-trans isomerase [Candidatus Scalindua sp.]|jgi:FKBP-type peptidyl-prolyl cis-trans isomerase|nr:FKBP-type peptidyl-prolyl cis-trans isomerase [Candidatus Scalindua sp.]MDV5166286.1 FKBP-type peptidyl-prolyl cis-trans isomerase [Candidatus Scalindua sp.]
MKLRIMLFSVFLMLFACSGITTAQDDTKPVSAAAEWSESQKLSYILGTQIGNFAKQSEFEVNLELFAKGLDDTAKGNEPAMSQTEISIFMAALQKKAQEKAQAAMEVAGAENAKVGQAFLDANKEKDGVKVTESGLQYKVITEGDGAKPKATDKVKVHYSGTLIGGKEFDSSYKRDQPSEFMLNQVIKGWTEGVQLMNVGSKYEFYIPSGLAYGTNGPPSIGPDQTLIFTVELLDITTP